MALTQRTIVEQIECTLDRTIQVRMIKQVINDAGESKFEQYHRTSIPPGVDATEQMQNVNYHLSAMGEAEVSDKDIQRVQNIADVEHTPEVIEKYLAKIKPPEEVA